MGDITSGAGLRLSVDRDILATALEGLIGSDTDPAGAMTALADKFTGQTAALTASTPELRERIKVQVAYDSLYNSLLLLQTMYRLPVTSPSRSKGAVNRYSTNFR